MPPALPARKAGGKRTPAVAKASTPVPETITLDDGTVVPVKLPPGMPPAAGQQFIEYLKSNPDAARAAYEQAMIMMKTPGLANAFVNMQKGVQEATPEQASRFNLLKDDPEFTHIFEDMAKNGPTVFQKYWDDTELMTKISQKLRALEVKEGTAPAAPAEVKAPENLHGAAKQGNVEAISKLLDDGQDVNAKNEKQVTVLGIAVGFNRVEAVKLLLSRGADLEARDAAGNTVLHYAAGYGRREIAEVLVEAGADMDAKNNAGQTPLEAARMNHEKAMVDFLKEKWVAKKKASRQQKAAE